MNNIISSFSYLIPERSMMLTYEDGTTETFTEADAERYVQLTGRPADADALGWSYTAPAAEDSAWDSSNSSPN